MNDKLKKNFGGSVDRHETGNTYRPAFLQTKHSAFSEISAMDVDSVYFNSELRRIEREIERCRPTLQSCRDEYENIETEICDVMQLQRKAQFVLDNMRSEEENLYDRFKNIRLNYEACVERSGGHEDPSETTYARMNELAMQRKELLEELARLKRKADDNGKKLARVRAMIVEQEEKNATQIQELKEISESNVFISPDIKKRIDAILGYREINESDGAVNNTMQ